MRRLFSSLFTVALLSLLLSLILYSKYIGPNLTPLNHLSYNPLNIASQELTQKSQPIYSTRNALKNITENVGVLMLSSHVDKKETLIVTKPPVVVKQSAVTGSDSMGTLSSHTDKKKTPVATKPPVAAKLPAVAKPLVVDEPVEDTTHGHRRYAISSSYWEQQSNGILNLFSLQRWANSKGMTAVEPFVWLSKIRLSPEIYFNNTWVDTLRLRDIIDLDYWNAQTKKKSVPPLEVWEKFILRSTKKIIVVIMPYAGAGGTYTNDKIKKHPECLKTMAEFFYNHSKLFHSLQFEVVRNVCISFDNYIIPPEIFNAGLQIENNKDITVWISEWRGVGNGRVSFTGLDHNKFGRLYDGEGKYLSMIKPSHRLENDSQRYVHQVLGVDFYQYDAVVARHKMMDVRGKEWNVWRFNNCASQLEMYRKSVTNKIFLAIDLGKYGDQVRPDRLDYDSQGKYTGHGVYLLRRYLGIVYGNKSIDSYEKDFVRVTNGVLEPGYIGGLQRTIASHANHVFLVGGHSSYLNSIIENFAIQHKRDSVTEVCFQ